MGCFSEGQQLGAAAKRLHRGLKVVDVKARELQGVQGQLFGALMGCCPRCHVSLGTAPEAYLRSRAEESPKRDPPVDDASPE